MANPANRLRFCLDQVSAGDYALIVSDQSTEEILKETLNFRVASEAEEVVLDIRAPRKIYANSPTTLRAISRNCTENETRRERRGEQRKRASETSFTRRQRRRRPDTKPTLVNKITFLKPILLF